MENYLEGLKAWLDAHAGYVWKDLSFDAAEESMGVVTLLVTLTIVEGPANELGKSLVREVRWKNKTQKCGAEERVIAINRMLEAYVREPVVEQLLN